MRIIKLIIYLLFLLRNLIGQQFIPADPFFVREIEQKQFSDSTGVSSLMVRPIINGRNTSNWRILTRSEFYYNNNVPNLENMGNRFVGKGVGIFTGINLSYSGKFIIFSLEPFYLTSQNKEVMVLGRDAMFGRLNDAGYNRDSPYSSIGFRETQLYLHYKHIGVGYSNANMWWGPGLHNTLTMTNNTTGFPHLMVGTLNEKRIRNIGINVRYIFSTLDKTIGDPYFTALVWTLRFYTDPLITIGLSRNYLSGGSVGDEWYISKMDAALIVFEELLLDTKIIKRPDGWNTYDPWDQTMSGFLLLDFPKSRLRLYGEFGTNDHRQNFSDLRAQPDHASASIIGLRKYGLFNNNHYVAGIEYSNIILAKTWKFRPTPNWYNKPVYDYSSYHGRRWAAHSGSDSDDLYIYFGYQSDEWAFIPALNYERHGVLYARPPEVKMEVRLDFRYTWNDYRFNVFFEREWLEHAGFIPGEWRIGNVLWFGVEKDVTEMFSNKLSGSKSTITD